ncbi:IclR family transcriptional regulator [Streptomyces sp. NBC_00455]|uniref:IclR family transcriptional regulator n=1 Tax=Streptomyces sp. NBC_00455 TaxID=2903654 RepID=UPI002E1B1FBA
MVERGADPSTTPPDARPQPAGVLQTVDRALLVLLTFTEQRPEWGVSELARHHGWDKAVVQRLLTTLTARTFLICDHTSRRYRPGPALSRLARVSEHSGVFSSLARPVLARLLRETGESIVLNVPHGGSYRCEAAVDGTGPVRYTAIIGAVIPGHAGASGHTIFAYHPEREVRQMFGPTGLTRFNDRTITDLDTLLSCYERVRADGHCISHGEYDEAVTAVSAPVFQGDGVAASLTAIGPSHRVDRATGTLVALVRAGAAEITAALGG